MYFHHIHSTFPMPPKFTIYPFLLEQLCVFIFLRVQFIYLWLFHESWSTNLGSYPLKKKSTIFLSICSYQLQTVPQLRVGLHEPLPYLVWDFCLTCECRGLVHVGWQVIYAIICLPIFLIYTLFGWFLFCPQWDSIPILG